MSDILSLKDHFATGATAEIESLFLISRSNCAFVNYRSEAACVAARDRFHNSTFRNRNLVCRLRQSATTSSSSSRSQEDVATSVESPASQFPEEEPLSPLIVGPVIEKSVRKTPARYFVLKSLTLHDLQASLSKGTWATQKHNESVLDKAFADAEAVYLVFSANKSGEYFGYARMMSAIPSEPTVQAKVAPGSNAQDSSYTPRTIPTSATATAPKGRIIDDLARGTIFWEAETPESEQSEGVQKNIVKQGEGACREFRIQWINTTKLPFFHTRGLRNPWNANREVKVARDGTELEPRLGKYLLLMFDDVGQNATFSNAQPGRMWG